MDTFARIITEMGFFTDQSQPPSVRERRPKEKLREGEKEETQEREEHDESRGIQQVGFSVQFQT